MLGSFDGAEHDVDAGRGLARRARRGRARARDQVPPPPGRRPPRRGAASSAASRRSTSCPRRSSCPTALRARRAVAPRGRRSRAPSSARSCRPRARRGAQRVVRAATPTAPGAHILPPSAAVEGDQSNRLGDGGGGSRRAARAQAGERSAARRAERRLRRAARAVRGDAPLARARRRRLRAADVGLPGRLQVAPRRPRRAGRARAHRLPDRRRPRARARRAADACACSARSRGSGAERPPSGAHSTACSCGRTGAGSWCRTARSLYILVRHPARFSRAAVMTYAVFDIGASVYWLLPTAPPWYAAAVAGEQVERDARGAAHDGRVRRASGETAGARSTVCSEAIPWPRCPLCTSPHP